MLKILWFFQNVVHFWLVNQSINQSANLTARFSMGFSPTKSPRPSLPPRDLIIRTWSVELRRRDETRRWLGRLASKTFFQENPCFFFMESPKKRPCAWKWFFSRLLWRLGTRVWNLMESYKCFAASSIFIYVWWSSKSISSIWHLLPLVFGQGPTVSSNHCLTKKLFRTA